MYDWANSAFSTTVMAGFFPVLFKQYWSAGVDASESSYRLGVANSLSEPGRRTGRARARCHRRRGRIAQAFPARQCGASASPPRRCSFSSAGGAWTTAAVVYVIAVIGFSASMIFYDALLLDVSTPATSDYVSAHGFALGYLGGGLLFAINIVHVPHAGAIRIGRRDLRRALVVPDRRDRGGRCSRFRSHAWCESVQQRAGPVASPPRVRGRGGPVSAPPAARRNTQRPARLRRHVPSPATLPRRVHVPHRLLVLHRRRAAPSCAWGSTMECRSAFPPER